MPVISYAENIRLSFPPQIGTSLFDEAGSKIVQRLVDKAKAKGVTLYLPVDFVIADKFDENAQTKFATVEEGIPDNWMGLDIGPKSAELLKAPISKAKLIIWNG